MKVNKKITVEKSNLQYIECDICGVHFDDSPMCIGDDELDVGEIWLVKNSNSYTLNACHSCMENVVFKWFKTNFNAMPQKSKLI